MNVRCLYLAVAVAGAVSAAVASAQAREDHGWFLEATVLEVDASAYRGSAAPDVFSGEDRGFAVKGSYAFTRHFALQAGYHDFGAGAQLYEWQCPPGMACIAMVRPPVRVRADLEALSFTAVGAWHATEKVELFGKLGVARANREVETVSLSVGTTISHDDRARGVLRGVGVGVWIKPRWRLDAQYERIDFDIESAGVGATYRF